MRKAARIALLLAWLPIASGGKAWAQTGSIGFAAHVTPGSGIQEPVRGLPFYLLSKSYEEIRKEAEATAPKPDLDKFVDTLEISPQLKAWMKRNQTVSLAGESFIKKLKTRDVMDTPEFYDAYLQRNSGDRSIDFPVLKIREKDKQKDPAKYKKAMQDYHLQIEKYLIANPQSADGIDLELAPIDPTHKWEELNASRAPVIRRRILELAGSNYLVARTETDLQGRGHFQGIMPGNYWLSTLNIYAEAGDVRVRWDAPVTLAAGAETRVELTNFNGIEPQREKP